MWVVEIDPSEADHSRAGEWVRDSELHTPNSGPPSLPVSRFQPRTRNEATFMRLMRFSAACPYLLSARRSAQLRQLEDTKRRRGESSL